MYIELSIVSNKINRPIVPRVLLSPEMLRDETTTVMEIFVSLSIVLQHNCVQTNDVCVSRKLRGS